MTFYYAVGKPSRPAVESLGRTPGQRGAVVYWLLMGGDKSTQQRDIKSALKMARALKQENP